MSHYFIVFSPSFIPLIFYIASTLLTPGPNNIMLSTSGMNFGIKKTLPHLLGIAIGFPSMLVISGLGLTSIFFIPFVREIMRWASGIIITYFAWKIATTRTTSSRKIQGKPFTFFQAFIFQWINPKAWVMTIGAVINFTSNDGGFILLVELLQIALLYFMSIFFCNGLWVVFGKAMTLILTNNFLKQLFNYLMAFLLAGSIWWIILFNI